MLKKNKGTLLLTSFIIILPILFGLLVWNRLPERMVTHWGVDGTANGWSSRSFAVFAMPLFILAAHWFCAFCTAWDPKNENQNNKVVGLVLWICPVVSLFSNALVYAAAFGKELDAYFITCILIGVLFVVTGNYLPKCRWNSTIGIKVKWALQSEQNWNATHRLAGKAWVVGGILVIFSALLPESIAMYALMAFLTLLALLPTGYSYYYYKTKEQG